MSSLPRPARWTAWFRVVTSFLVALFCLVVSARAQVALPRAQAGLAYSHQVTTTPPAAAGSGYSATGLPAGLSIGVSSGIISGQPTVSGNFSGTISITSSSSVNSFTYTLAVDLFGLPVFLAQPTSVVARRGSAEPLAFFANASGTPSPGYQWRKDGVPLPGENRYALIVSPATSASVGVYDVVVSNSVGTITSAPATLLISDVYENPVGPQGTTLWSVGASQSLGVRLTLNATERIVGVTVDMATGSGTFFVALVPLNSSSALPLGSGSAIGSLFSATEVVASATFTLPAVFSGRVAVPLSYLAAPGTYGVIVGSGAFGTSGSGSMLRYETGSNSSSFFRNGPPGGPYSWSNSPISHFRLGLVTAVGPITQPVIVVPPASVAVALGGKATLTVVASGPAPLSYQWAKDGSLVSGATTATLLRSNLQATDVGAYTVTVSSSGGTVTSEAAALTLSSTPSPIVNVTGPAPRTNLSPDTTQAVTATASAEPGRTVVTLGFYANDTLIANTQVAPYTVNWTPSLEGTYALTARAMDNAQVFTTSPPLIVTVSRAGQPVVSLTAPAATSTLTIGASVNLAATAAAIAPRRLESVTFAVNGVALGSPLATAPFTATWTPPAVGTYTLTAEGVDDLGIRGLSPVATVTVLPPSTPPVVATALGWRHALYLRADGTLLTTGDNSSGQLGDGTRTSRTTPYVAATGVTAIAVNGFSSYFLKTDGTAWAMGNNSSGQLGDGTTTLRESPVQIALTQVVALSAGGSHLALLRADGTLWTVGHNSDGQLGDGTTTSRLAPQQVAAGVTAIGAAGSTTHYLTADRRLWSMGSNLTGQVGDGSFTSRSTAVPVATSVASLAPGIFHTMFVKIDGSLWGMGQGSGGALGTGSVSNAYVPVRAISSGVASVTAGSDNTLFINTDGTLWGVGRNESGQLGLGTSASSQTTPTQVATGVTSASISTDHSRFLKTDGTLWASGGNAYGQFGDGTTTGTLSPVRLFPSSVAPVAPAIPSAVAATTALGYVRLTWPPLVGVTRYEVWRSPGPDSSGATALSTSVPSALFYDTTATPGLTHYYWVKAAAFDAASGFSAATPGASALVPTIVTSPTPLTAGVGASATFTVVATGFPAPTYQWRQASQPLPGATSATYTIPSVSLADAASFDVVVTNAFGSATSAPVTLTVQAPPAITSAPSTAFFINRAVSFTLTATGTPAPTFSATGLPAWLTLNATTGVLSGTAPDATGAPFSFSVTATNGIGTPATETFVLQIRTAHSADVSPADGTINLAELTRVIELYNARTGTLRTGCYVASAVTVDGYAPDPAVTAGPIPTTLHSADLNRDGRLSLDELTRVIELYNARTGTTRHGSYRSDATTVDGFAPGP